MPNYGPYISKITLPNGVSYDIKDQEARDLIASIVAGGLTFVVSTNAANTPSGLTWENAGVVITGTLAASTDTKAYIYLVPHEKDSQGIVDYYREYVTVNFGTEAEPTWAWEFLGDTDIDLSDLGALARKDSATGTIKVTTADSGSFSNGTVNASATYTPTGSVNVTLSQTSTAASLTKSDYTPAGTVSKPSVSVTPTTATVEVKDAAGSVTAGSAASFTSGAFDGGSFTQGTDQFIAPSWSATVPNDPETQKSTETLVISFSAGSFSQGTDSFTPASHDADTFHANTPTSVTLPTFKEQSVMTGASAELDAAPTFTGTTAENALVTEVNYDKAGVQSQTFSGTEATISSTGTASGDVTLTKTEKDINVTVS